MQLSISTPKQGVILASFVVVTGFVYSLTVWSGFDLSTRDVFDLAFAFDPNSIPQQIIATLRLPRTLVALLVGANLAVAGAVMQGMTRNPLASPAILGVNAGAACFMALSSIGIGGLSDLPLLMAAALGGGSGGALVLVLGGALKGRIHPLRLILAGIAVNALLTGLTRAAVILADDMAYSVLHWLAGTVAEASWQQWHRLWPPSLFGLLLALLLAAKMNVLSLGEDTASGLGINVSRIRAMASLAVVLLTAASVSIAGPISFVGLMVPHLARKIVGSDHRVLIPTSALFGAALLVWSDILSRGVAFPGETPVGIITALLGTPCFIFLALRSKT